MAAEVGQLGLAYDYLGEAALMDLEDIEHNTRDGVHIASLAGTWIALVVGFAGLRRHRDMFSFAPRLPDDITRLAFNILVSGQRLRVDVTHEHASYRADDGKPLKIAHHGTPVTLSGGKAQKFPIPKITPGPRPTQPPGREPARHRGDKR
jgi:alpha,alpha-trehalose phosphorylase